jgi:hypothetical protein
MEEEDVVATGTSSAEAAVERLHSHKEKKSTKWTEKPERAKRESANSVKPGTSVSAVAAGVKQRTLFDRRRCVVACR